MANSFLTIGMVTYEMLMVLHNLVVAAKKANRNYEKQFARVGAKIGQQVQIRKPPLYTVTDGPTFVAQDYAETSVPLTLNKHKQVGVEFLNDDLVLSMDDFRGRFLEPAIVPLANIVDTDIMSLYTMAWEFTGTPGVTPAQDLPFLDAKTLITANAAGGRMWPMIVSLTTDARLSSGLAGRFNPQKDISGLYLEGSMGPALGWDFYKTQNVQIFTTGAWSASVPATGITVNLAGQTGSTINVTGATAGVNNIGLLGDIVQFAGVYKVNPVTYLNTGLLQNFVLTANVNSDGGGNIALPISPPIIIVGKGQTVTNSPANGAQVLVWGNQNVAQVASVTSAQCMGWASEAVTMAMADLKVFGEGEGVKCTRMADDDLGMSVLYTRGVDIREFSEISRMDILYGMTMPRPEHAVRVAAMS